MYCPAINWLLHASSWYFIGIYYKQDFTFPIVFADNFAIQPWRIYPLRYLFAVDICLLDLFTSSKKIQNVSP